MPHGIWKGTLGFGLVSIGVELFAAESPGGLSLEMLDKRDLGPVGYRKYNKTTGADLETAEIVKGYEISKGKYVVLNSEDLAAANPKSTRTIDVLGFVDAGAIGTIYFDKPYVVAPLKGSEKAYALLVQTLEETEQMGLAQIVIRTAQHVAALYPYESAIVVHLLRYASEVRAPSEFGVTTDSAARSAIRPAEMAMARQLVASMSTTWDPSEFKDTYHDDLLRLIESRAAGAVLTATVSAEDDIPRVLDLVAALKSSLAARSKSGVAGRGTARGTKTATTLRRAAVTKAAKSVQAQKVIKSASKPAKRQRRSA